MKRGIIAAPGIISRLPNGFKMERSITLDELRYYALYWDKVVIPDNSLMSISFEQEEGFILAKAIERPTIDVYGEFELSKIPDMILSCQSQIASKLVKDKEMDWVIQQFGDELIIPDKFYVEERNTLRIDLARCLPVPTGKANIYDILDFKELRKNEFIALHEHIDEVYQQALLSPDQGLASKAAISKLKRSIHDLNIVTDEKFKKIKRRDLSVIFNPETLITDVITMGVSGIPIPIATLSRLISVSIDSTQTFRPANKNSKLAYLSNAQKYGLY